jgi:hypothetical protein
VSTAIVTIAFFCCLQNRRDINDKSGCGSRNRFVCGVRNPFSRWLLGPTGMTYTVRRHIRGGGSTGGKNIGVCRTGSGSDSWIHNSAHCGRRNGCMCSVRYRFFSWLLGSDSWIYDSPRGGQGNGCMCSVRFHFFSWLPQPKRTTYTGTLISYRATTSAMSQSPGRRGVGCIGWPFSTTPCVGTIVGIGFLASSCHDKLCEMLGVSCTCTKHRQHEWWRRKEKNSDTFVREKTDGMTHTRQTMFRGSSASTKN